MIEKADLNGCEIILDIGTGAGYAAINFARKLSTGSVIGIDKYDLKNQGIFQRFLNELKINFFGNSLNNAKKNSQIEGVENKISFIKADLIQPFPFSSNYFDLIISSQFLYCISHNKLTHVLIEIDRVLNDTGKLVFFESNKFMFWDIYHLKDFFTDKGYNVKITPLDSLSNKSIFIAEKKNK
jgi:ubiquinone/menaquinone biosynthesis C-methylase UbiE